MQLKNIILFFSLVLLISCNDKKQNKTEEVKSTKISYFEDLENNKVALSQFKGKRVLVNFWATWCTPCLQEMPNLVHAQELLKDENYVFLFPSPDGLERIKKFKKDKNYPLEFLQFKASLDKFDIYALPATFIYNTEGEMVKRIDGATAWDSDEIINLLKSIK